MATNQWNTARGRVNNALVLTVALVLAAGLGGCLIQRAKTVKSQFCDFNTHFELRFGETAEWVFNQPVMLDTDVLWLTDSEPTETHQSGERKTMVFVLQKFGVAPDPATDIRMEMHFERLSDRYKLAGIRFDPKFSAVLNPDVLDPATVREGSRMMCETGYSLTYREIELDLSGHSFDDLPQKHEIVELLGSPTQVDPHSGSFTYQYRLRNSKPPGLNTQFTVWFDETGRKPARIESRYSHFRTSADFQRKEMRVQLDLTGR